MPRDLTARELTHAGIQLGIAALGVAGMFIDNLDWLLAWCVVGTLYVIAAVAVLWRKSVRPSPLRALPEKPWMRAVRGVTATVLTFVTGFVGISASLLVILMGHDKGLEGLAAKVVGVWAMLLGWAFVNWGFSQIYAHRSALAAPGKVLEFPHTQEPGLVDHTYFGFTVGTTFAASDVSVLTTRMRWLVTVHSVIAFGMNALTIALAMNTIMSAGG